MNKSYQIQAQLSKTSWATIRTETRQTDALDYIRKGSSEFRKYPLRIVRVVKTVVFEEKK